MAAASPGSLNSFTFTAASLKIDSTYLFFLWIFLMALPIDFARTLFRSFELGTDNVEIFIGAEPFR